VPGSGLVQCCAPPVVYVGECWLSLLRLRPSCYLLLRRRRRRRRRRHVAWHVIRRPRLLPLLLLPLPLPLLPLPLLPLPLLPLPLDLQAPGVRLCCWLCAVRPCSRPGLGRCCCRGLRRRPLLPCRRRAAGSLVDPFGPGPRAHIPEAVAAGPAGVGRLIVSQVDPCPARAWKSNGWVPLPAKP
jgi:hypothetical protein